MSKTLRLFGAFLTMVLAIGLLGGGIGNGPTPTPATIQLALPPMPPGPSMTGLISPPNGVTFWRDSNVAFEWPSVPGATEYYLEYWGAPYEGRLSSKWTPNAFFQQGQMWPGHTYLWHVKARNDAGESRWSALWQFTISLSLPPADAAGCLGAPRLQPRSNEPIPAMDSVTFAWLPPVDCEPGGYTVQITPTVPNASPIEDKGIDGVTTDYTYRFQPGTYDFSVRACEGPDTCRPYIPGAWGRITVVIGSSAPPPPAPTVSVNFTGNPYHADILPSNVSFSLR